MVPGGKGEDDRLCYLPMEQGVICRGGYCEMCPEKIQLECEDRRMTPIRRIDHIRQCLRLMKPTMGVELAGAAAIETELAALELIFTRLGEMVETALSTEDRPCA